MTELQKAWRDRILIGGALGAVCYIALATLVGNFNLFGPTTLDKLYFSMASLEPRWLGTALDYLLWFAFGAEIAIATLPFDDRGKALALKSLAHFAVMMLTVSAWVWLEFSNFHLSAFLRDLPGFLLPVAAVYAGVWGIRWVGWYFELESIKAKLGLTRRKGDSK